MAEVIDKKDEGKAPMELLACVFGPLAEVAKVMAFGNKKYRDVRNFRSVPGGRERYIGAALRHVFAYLDGAGPDVESGCSHLAHGACDLLMALWFDQQKPVVVPAPPDVWQVLDTCNCARCVQTRLGRLVA